MWGSDGLVSKGPSESITGSTELEVEVSGWSSNPATLSLWDLKQITFFLSALVLLTCQVGTIMAYFAELIRSKWDTGYEAPGL